MEIERRACAWVFLFAQLLLVHAALGDASHADSTGLVNLAFLPPVRDAAASKYFRPADESQGQWRRLARRGLEQAHCNLDDGQLLSFQHGVASGDPQAHRVVLWTKVTVAANGSSCARPGDNTVSLRLEVRDAATDELVLSGVVTTNARVDYTIKVDATGLRQWTRYTYQFSSLDGRARSTLGRTTTLPEPNDAYFDRLRLGIFSCSNWPFGFFNAYKHAADHRLDIVLHLGDYIYEYGNGRYGDGTDIGRIHEPDVDVVALSEYRARYAQYRTDADLQRLHALVPWITIWDDHEFADDSYTDGAINHDVFSQGSWTARKANAVQAYYEYLPIRQFDEFDQYALKPRIFRTFDIGQLASLVMLDTRMYGREMTDLLRSARVADANRTMLGAVQEQWLQSELARSQRDQRRWRILGNQVIFSHFEPFFRIAPDRDSWDNYPATRERLLRFIDSAGIDNVVVVTGDIHSSWVHEIASDPWNGRMYNRHTGEGCLGVEFVGPSVTSPGPGDVKGSIRRFTDIVQRFILYQEPHLKYVDTYRHGFMVLELTPERVRNEYWYVSTIRSRNSTAIAGPVFEVQSGYSHLERVE